MANQDDDLTNHHGDETFDFDDSNDEFAVPDTPYGDDDNAFADEDLLGAEGLDDEIIEGNDDFSIGDEAEVGEQADYQEVGYDEHVPEDHPSPEYYDDEEAPASTGLGWKTYVGVAAAMVLTAGGLVMFLFPGDPEPSRQAQAMDPARLQQIAQQNATQSQQQSATAQNQSAQTQQPPQQPQAQNGPVDVEPFPSGSRSDPQQTGMGNGGSGTSGSGGNGGGQMSGDSVPSSPIADPNSREPERDRNYDQVNQQRQLAMMDQQIEEIGSQFFVRKDEFAVLGRVVEKSQDKLQSIDRGLSESQREIRALERRVAELERESGKSAKTPEKELEPDPEVKDAQVVLTAYGYVPGPIDGLMGTRTKAALVRFQKAHDLEMTGELDRATRKQLDGDPKKNPYPVRRTATRESSRSHSTSTASNDTSQGWFIRGVTKNRAIVFKKDGTSYAVEHGTEIPGMGQVIAFYPQKRQVETSKGMIREL
jgi:hypothetical protein